MYAFNPKITHSDLREQLDYVQDTGLFFWKKAKSKIRVGNQAGSLHWRGYVAVYVSGHSYLAHRLAWFYVHGEWPTHGIDHINGNRADNRLVNLRDVTQKENMQNRRLPKKNRVEGMLGTHWNPRIKKWHATLCVDGKNKHLGLFATTEQAHEVYLQEKRKQHPGCTI